ncbi:3'(2'),5'-bisphosphate nucleotidase CysQ [Suttonella sp. R2A3]|uniref:3'(2'),5'-bisphosphate nucleotidase CysQ family protein n=1 Tax=Suttonella sp. R2A3 TaxID=2908648 RepID=UPI001F212AE5|nr:3'(2'),5'-bisphosphate nucleotidase CysQ [Suttonella sp. R2A3]UJF25207.1 3'(2'),5'-bisphosphate nucleotidase CysQ [Suttonella sp. R2A3]
MLTSRDQQLVAQLTALCHETSAVILSYYRDQSTLNITQKDNNTPLTEADLAAHDALLNGLPKILKLPIISEESSPEVHQQRHSDYWLIDPIDGTREFIEHTDEFCIAIARIENHRPTLAYIYAPTTGKYWFALHGKGTYKGDSTSPEVKRLYGRSIADPATIITARIKLSRRMNGYLRNLFGDYTRTTRGSALKFCVIAEGGADIYPKLSYTTSEWDIAAGDLLLSETGGGIVLFDNTVPRYGCKDDTLNPPFLAYGGGISETQIAEYCRIMREVLTQN